MEINTEKWKEHPRIIELRFSLLFDMFEREYGYQNTMKFYEAIANAFNCDMTKLIGLVNRRYDLKRLSRSKTVRWKQEVIFAAYCYGETIYKVAKDYLITAASNLYSRPDKYDINRFVTDEWLRQLDDEVVLVGMKAYKTEIKRFFETIDNLTATLVRWKGMN
jgi:hypothetical protein